MNDQLIQRVEGLMKRQLSTSVGLYALLTEAEHYVQDYVMSGRIQPWMELLIFEVCQDYICVNGVTPRTKQMLEYATNHARSAIDCLDMIYEDEISPSLDPQWLHCHNTVMPKETEIQIGEILL